VFRPSRKFGSTAEGRLFLFAADANFTGHADTTTASIAGAGAVPMEVYQSGAPAASSLRLVGGLTANSSYTIQLHFAEIYWNNAGSRIFNVSVNGTRVLSNVRHLCQGWRR